MCLHFGDESRDFLLIFCDMKEKQSDLLVKNGKAEEKEKRTHSLYSTKSFFVQCKETHCKITLFCVIKNTSVTSLGQKCISGEENPYFLFHCITQISPYNILSNCLVFITIIKSRDLYKLAKKQGIHKRP